MFGAFMNCSPPVLNAGPMPRLTMIHICLLCLLSHGHCSATTAIVVITPSAIVVGTDSYSIESCASTSAGCHTGSNTTTKKLVVIKDRITLSNIGLGDQIVTDSSTGQVVFRYAFLD